MKARVLVVEDESLVAMMVEDCLIELGYEVAAVAPMSMRHWRRCRGVASTAPCLT